MGNASETSLFVSKISKENDFVLGIIYVIFGILSLAGNGILLFVAYRKRSSLKPAEFFVVNLSFSDLGMTVTLFPFAISSTFAHRWLYNEVICLCYAFCGVLFGLASLTNLTVLSSVCCLKVCYPTYGNKFSSCHAFLLVMGVWCYALVFALGPLSGWGKYGPEPYGTACCIDWEAPGYSASAMAYIISLFSFCYIVPCTVIFFSYIFILVTVRSSRQAVQQHMSPKNKITNAHTLIVKLSVAVCIGFLTAWSPYASVAMWAAFGNPLQVPPMAFALAAMFAKSSTLYNPVVYLFFKPNFRKSLCRDLAQCRRSLCVCGHSPARKGPCAQSERSGEDRGKFTHGQSGTPGAGRLCSCPQQGSGSGVHCQDYTPQRTARILTGSTHCELAVSQLSNEMQSDFL